MQSKREKLVESTVRQSVLSSSDVRVCWNHTMVALPILPLREDDDVFGEVVVLLLLLVLPEPTKPLNLQQKYHVNIDKLFW